MGLILQGRKHRLRWEQAMSTQQILGSGPAPESLYLYLCLISLQFPQKQLLEIFVYWLFSYLSDILSTL